MRAGTIRLLSRSGCLQSVNTHTEKKHLNRMRPPHRARIDDVEHQNETERAREPCTAACCRQTFGQHNHTHNHPPLLNCVPLPQVRLCSFFVNWQSEGKRGGGAGLCCGMRVVVVVAVFWFTSSPSSSSSVSLLEDSLPSEERDRLDWCHYPPPRNTSSSSWCSNFVLF